MMHLHIRYDGEILPIHVKHYSHGHPAQTFGPPELCYEGEPAELEWEPMSVDKGLNQYIQQLPSHRQRIIERLIWQKIKEYNKHDDYPEPPEHYYDCYDRTGS